MSRADDLAAWRATEFRVAAPSRAFPEPTPQPRSLKDRLALLSDFKCGYITRLELRAELALLE